ncbi:MAG: hypothetical protein IPJ75_15785 [Ignavibacteriales bacterium]|nr:hypothetical protein [Ignavibacteriales bacterium]
MIRDLIPPKFINSVMIEIIPLFTPAERFVIRDSSFTGIFAKKQRLVVSFGERLSAG